MMQQNAPEEFGAFIGIDWADQTHFVSLMDLKTQEVQRYKLEQKPEVLLQWVNDLQQRFPGQRVAVALEQSRGALIYALMSYGFFVLFPVNPKALAKYRAAFNVGGAKDDPTDSDLLLELVTLHRSKLRAWRPDDELTRAITLLVQYRRELVGNRTALTHRLAGLLKLYFPQALQWAGDLDTVQACDFLERWPTLPKVQKTPAAKLRQFYVTHNCRTAAVIAERLQQIQTARPLTTDSAVITTSVAMVQAMINQLRPLMASIKDLDKRIAELFAKHEDYELFNSFPGAGEALAPRLLSALGADRNRFESAAEIQRLSGIAPVMERSGKSCWVHHRFACPKFLRQSFHEFAAQSIRQSAWARTYYNRQRERGNGHHAAVRSLAFRWIRIIYRCWQMRVPYSEETYQQALSRRGSTLARLIPVDKSAS